MCTYHSLGWAHLPIRWSTPTVCSWVDETTIRVPGPEVTCRPWLGLRSVYLPRVGWDRPGEGNRGDLGTQTTHRLTG